MNSSGPLVKRGYKVVHVAHLFDKGLTYTSAAVGYESRMCVTYPVGEWAATPEQGRRYGFYLCYFPRLQDAQAYARLCAPGKTRLFSCEVDSVKALAGKRIEFLSDDEEEYTDLYYLLEELHDIEDRTDIMTMDWPPGTQMAERIRLLEEIPIEYASRIY